MKRRTVLKGLGGAVVAAAAGATGLEYASGGKVDISGSLSAVFDVAGWPAPEEYALCMPHHGPGIPPSRTWLEMIVSPKHVPDLGTSVIVELKDFDMLFEGTVTNVEPADENFKISVIEQMRRDDI